MFKNIYQGKRVLIQSFESGKPAGLYSKLLAELELEALRKEKDV